MAFNGYSYSSSGEQWYQENGRFYGTYHRGQYLLPVDEEELDRLDIFHKFFHLARENDAYAGLHQRPLPMTNPRVLDLGCGTGIWAIDMADRFPYARVIGLDLNFTQPDQIPRGLEFRQQDIEEPNWGLEVESFDMCHIQMLAGSIYNWPALYQNALRHLKPGAFIEHVEIDFTPHGVNGSLRENMALVRWARDLTAAFAHARQHLNLEPLNPEAMLKQAGFEDVQCATHPVPYHPWPEDEKKKVVGRWFNLGMIQGVQALSMAPLTRYGGYSREQVDDLLSEVKREICTRSIVTQCHMHIWTARRPGLRKH